MVPTHDSGPDVGTSTSTAVSPELLRGLFLFEALTDEQLSWLAERSEVRAFDAGAPVYREGEPADAVWVLVDGEVQLLRASAGEEVVITQTSHTGAYAGAIRAYVNQPSPAYETSMLCVRASRFMRLPATAFATFMRERLPMAVHLLDGLYIGVRNSEATMRQREHLAQLGSLSANLAHELNNPAAAAVRATAQLRERVAGMRHKLGMIAQGGIDPAAIHRLVAVQEEVIEQAAKAREPLGVLAESDLEDEIADRLEGLDVAGALELAPVLAAAGVDVERLDEIARQVGEAQRDGAFRWLAYALETEALMDEIEDASTRISTLVGAVKQYSHMDQATHTEVDLHPGLDSTVVMLGHKLSGIAVHREYDRSLPAVPAYAAELNQVWTNLIDNAADAMAGHGTITLRTRRDGDDVLVEVADEGPGVPEEVRERLFEPFVSTKGPGLGSGLGLDNARRIVERRHSGSLTYTTSERGSVFTARLPLRAPAQPVATPNASPSR